MMQEHWMSILYPKKKNPANFSAEFFVKDYVKTEVG